MPETSEKVFLSYAKEDEEKVDDIYHFLHASGIDAWMDKYNLIGGQKWDSRIEKEINSAAVFIAFLSTASVPKNGMVQREFKFALKQQTERPEGSTFIMPVKIDNCDIPDEFRDYHCVSLNNFQEARKLLHSIEEAIAIRNEFASGEVSQNVLQRPLHHHVIDEPSQNIHNKDFVVIAPFRGMFYRGPSPSEDPYCEKDSVVKKGEAMFILESCKTFIVFLAHRDGRVAAILADNDTFVEEQDPLIVFRPT